MPFNDWPLFVKCLVGVLGPPVVTTFCWLAAPLLPGVRRKRSSAEFWLMLLAAYIVFAIALAGTKIHLQSGDDDPSQLVR